MTVLAAHNWPTNADLIADVAKLGYLDGPVLDTTYGEGTFWKMWRPNDLTACDIDPAKSPIGYSVDFTSLPFKAGMFRAVVFDPPYKLNGTPDPEVDARYGVDRKATIVDRLRLIRDGLQECARVTATGGHLLAKCQDQVASGVMWWQTAMVSSWLSDPLVVGGFTKVDSFDLLGKHRPQPMEGRTQKHAHGRPSTLLVFRRWA